MPLVWHPLAFFSSSSMYTPSAFPCTTFSSGRRRNPSSYSLEEDYSAFLCLCPWHAYCSSFSLSREGGQEKLQYWTLPSHFVFQAFPCPAWKDLLQCQWTSPATPLIAQESSVVTGWFDLKPPITIVFYFKLWGKGRQMKLFRFFFFALFSFV